MKAADASQVLESLLVTLSTGEGARIGLIGDSGTGKTSLLLALLRLWLSRLPRGLAVVVDGSGKRQFAGQDRVDLDDLKARPLSKAPALASGADGARMVVLTGDVRRRIEVDPEKVARYVWSLAFGNVPTVLALDELADSAREGYWLGKSERIEHGWTEPDRFVDLPRLFSHGRKFNASAFWCSTTPQELPRVVGANTPALACFHSGGRELAYVEKIYRVPTAGLDAMAALPDPLAGGERGVFVVVERGGRWHGPYRAPRL